VNAPAERRLSQAGGPSKGHLAIGISRRQAQARRTANGASRTRIDKHVTESLLEPLPEGGRDRPVTDSRRALEGQ